MTTYPPATAHSDSINRPACPKCGTAMLLFGIEAESPGHELSLSSARTAKILKRGSEKASRPTQSALFTHCPPLTGFGPFADLLFRWLRAPCQHHRQQLGPGRRWLRDKSRSRLCRDKECPPCRNLTRLIRRTRSLCRPAQNVEAQCGSPASNLPTSPTTIYARSNVRNANIPKRWWSNLNRTLRRRQTDVHCNSQPRSVDPLSASAFLF